MTWQEDEELAKEFSKDTGFLAPFKDAPVACGNDPHYDQTLRRQEWDKWMQQRKGPVQPTLTAMLEAKLEEYLEFITYKDTIPTIKAVFKDWLRTVGLPHQMSEEATRQLLITLVDEP